jgi:hypothetical protein
VARGGDSGAGRRRRARETATRGGGGAANGRGGRGRHGRGEGSVWGGAVGWRGEWPARRGALAAAGGRRGGGQTTGVTERVRGEKEGERRTRGRFIFFLYRVPDKDFLKILKYSLSSAKSLALGKVVFAECELVDTRQRFFYYSLPSVNKLTLGRGYFAECHFWTLGKLHFL